jgi:hypothetical protein
VLTKHSTVRVLERRDNGRTTRVRTEQGWVSMQASDGATILQDLGEPLPASPPARPAPSPPDGGGGGGGATPPARPPPTVPAGGVEGTGPGEAQAQALQAQAERASKLEEAGAAAASELPLSSVQRVKIVATEKRTDDDPDPLAGACLAGCVLATIR